MKYILLICLFVNICSAIYSQAAYEEYKTYWPNLQTLKYDFNIEVVFNPKSCKIGSDKLLKKNYIPTHKEVLLLYRKDQTTVTILMMRSPALPLFDGLYLTTGQEDKAYEKAIWCKKVIVPGNGYIYAIVPIERNGLKKIFAIEKYRIENNEIVLCKQPLYSLNKKGITGADIVLYSERNTKSEKIADIPKGKTVFILGIDKIRYDGAEYDWYLVESPLGLVGWHKPFQVDYKVTYAYHSINILDGQEP